MHRLKENNSIENTFADISTTEIENTGSMSSNNENMPSKPKTPLKKEDLEKIAKQLKNKLSKASITAKQSISPNSVKSGVSKTSPLRAYQLKRQFSSPNASGLLSSSPTGLGSPNGKSPVSNRTPGSMQLASSPLKNTVPKLNEDIDKDDSPTKDKSRSLDLKGKSKPQMILQQIGQQSSPLKPQESDSLNPSLTLSANQSPQTTPLLQKKQLSANTNTSNSNPLLKTPTQSAPGSSGNYNDEVGADLLMYLATSPSPAKPYYSNTPRGGSNTQQPSSSLPNSAGSMSANKPSSSSSQNSFIVPPPLTPKRHLPSSSRTPQNKLTPSVNLFNALANNDGTSLPSSGLALTPAGFNMNDYVNFFTPSPGGGSIINNPNTAKGFMMKTPDFASLTSNANPKSKVDGKMINFDKVLFGSTNSTNEHPKDKVFE